MRKPSKAGMCLVVLLITHLLPFLVCPERVGEKAWHLGCRQSAPPDLDMEPPLHDLWNFLAKSKPPPRFLQFRTLHLHVGRPTCYALPYILKIVFCFHQHSVEHGEILNTDGTYPLIDAIISLDPEGGPHSPCALCCSPVARP